MWQRMAKKWTYHWPFSIEFTPLKSSSLKRCRRVHYFWIKWKWDENLIIQSTFHSGKKKVEFFFFEKWNWCQQFLKSIDSVCARQKKGIANQPAHRVHLLLNIVIWMLNRLNPRPNIMLFTMSACFQTFCDGVGHSSGINWESWQCDVNTRSRIHLDVFLTE